MRITISGLSGVGSSSTAKLVSERLNLPMTNTTFRTLAQERGVPFEEIQRLAATTPEIDYELDRRLIAFINSHPNSLAASDIACWLDQPGVYEKLGLPEGAKIDYKIWLEAPVEVRMERMHGREGGDQEEMIKYNLQRDEDNRQRYRELYGIDIFDHRKIDWVFNTSQYSLEEVVDKVVERLQQIVYTKQDTNQ